jgi:ATP-dependent Clp protease ATP-binding subunit ClpA
MFERFTTAARSVVLRAREHAVRDGHREIEAQDLLLGVLDDVDGVPARVLRTLGMGDPATLQGTDEKPDPSDEDALRSIGIDLDAVRCRAEESFGAGALDRHRRQRPGLFGRRTAGGHLPLSNEAKASLEGALRAATSEGHRSLGSEHLFLGLLATEQGTALGLLRRLGVTEDAAGLRRRVLEELRRAA